MSIRNRVATMVDSVVERVVEHGDALTKGRLRARNTADLTVNCVLGAENLSELQFPQLYLRFMQEWVREVEVKVEIVKPMASATDPTGVRFSTLLAELVKRLPMAPMPLAREAGIYADAVLARTDAIEYSTWAADVGLHFQIGSSLGQKGRLLHALLRFTRPSSYLELGTAYGMSALIAARTLQTLGAKWSVTTIEALPLQYDIAAGMLRQRFDATVDCRLGWSTQSLKELSAERRSFDFLLHDAAHSYDDYVNDFALAEPMLRAGTVCLIDDIRWEDSRFSSKPARCYEGWRSIASHPRVRAAAELDGDMGILLLS